MEVVIIALIFWALKKLPKIMEARINGASIPVGRTLKTDVKTIPAEDAQGDEFYSAPEGTVTLEGARVFTNMETPATFTGEQEYAYKSLILPPQTQDDFFESHEQHRNIELNTHNVLPSFTGDDLVRAVVMSEILTRPINRRRRA